MIGTPTSGISKINPAATDPINSVLPVTNAPSAMFCSNNPEVGIPVGVMVAGVVGTVLMIGGMVGGIFSELEKIRLDSL
jgi:hypothetical protein